MSDDEEMEQLVVEVPKNTKQIAKRNLEHGGLSREVRATLARIAHGEEVAEVRQVKDNLEDLRDERANLKQKRDTIENELQDVERKIERGEAKLERLRDIESEYEGRLKGIEERMQQEDMHVWPEHGVVKSTAEDYGQEPDDIIQDLRERNPELPDEQFQTKGRGI